MVLLQGHWALQALPAPGGRGRQSPGEPHAQRCSVRRPWVLPPSPLPPCTAGEFVPGQNELGVFVGGFYLAFSRNQLLSGNIDDTCFGALGAKGQTEGLVRFCQSVGPFACEASMPCGLVT